MNIMITIIISSRGYDVIESSNINFTKKKTEQLEFFGFHWYDITHWVMLYATRSANKYYVTTRDRRRSLSDYFNQLPPWWNQGPRQ